MLLDYAAQVKCRTAKRVVSTCIGLAHLPTDVRHFIVHFSSNAQQLLLHLHAELRAITSRRHAKARIRQNLQRTQLQLRKATALIDQGNAVIHHVTSHGSDGDDEDDDSHSTLDPDATLSRVEEEDVQSGVEADDADSGDARHPDIDLLTEQIRLLKEQMERFAQLQLQAETTTAADPHSVDREEGDAEGEESGPSGFIPVAPAFDIPAAPPLTQSSLYPSIPIASPMLPNNHSVPMAPPLLSTHIPDAPPLLTSSAIPTAPPLIPYTPATSSSPLSSPSPYPSPSPSHLAPPPPPLTHSLPALPPRPILSDVTRSRSNRPPPTIYTRNIPGADQLSHTDLIQVAARIKLRRTDIPRSPGGTPCKRVGGQGGGFGGDAGGIGEALRMKFRNAHGLGGGGGRGSAVRRSTGGEGGDKENNDSWNTD